MIDLIVQKGEVLRRCFRLCSNDRSDSLIVTSAVWDLYDAAGAVVAHGACEIDRDKLWITSPFTDEGDFVLQCTASVPPETLKCNARIRVEDRTREA